jgi:hypothetical protein
MDSTQIAKIKDAADKIALTLTEQPATRDSFLQDPVNTINRLAPTLIEGLDQQQLATLGAQLKKDKYLSGTTSLTKLGDKIRCWSCRIGLNAAIIGLGTGAMAALIAAGVVTGGAAAVFIDLLVTWGLAEVAATGVVSGALAAGGTSILGVTEAMVELACDAIPHTCG